MKRSTFTTLFTISGFLCLLLLVNACMPGRSTTIKFVEFDDVGFLALDEKEFTKPEARQILQPGDLLISGPSVGFLLKFNDGTTLRASPGTAMNLIALDPKEGEQAASFHLSTGTIWVLLKGKPVEIQTFAGNAIVSGSMMSVGVDQSTFATELTCLEGHCTLSNELGSTSLDGGQAAYIPGMNQAPSSAQSMTQAQLDDWEESNPKVKAITVSLAGTISKETDPDTNASTPAATISETCPLAWGPLAGGECFHYHFENNCRGGNDAYELVSWGWLFQYDWEYNNFWMWIAPGQTLDGWLPAGNYRWVMELTSKNDGHYPVRNTWWSQTYAPGASISVKLCPDEPDLPTGTLTEPLKYYLANNCVGVTGVSGNTVWHWSFVNVRGANPNDPRLETVELAIPLGESRSGELPPGLWWERDWTENGSVDNPASLRNGGYDFVNLCPDNPPLPDQPER